jgi:hypothetical protein
MKHLHLGERVTLSDFIPRDQVPALLADSTSSSFRPGLEPLARILQEGMATGVVVVATAVGGTVEIVEDGVNGLCCSRPVTRPRLRSGSSGLRAIRYCAHRWRLRPAHSGDALRPGGDRRCSGEALPTRLLAVTAPVAGAILQAGARA